MSLLDEIFAHKRTEVSEKRLNIPETDLEKRLDTLPRPASFLSAIQNPALPQPRLIAEVKHRSPSKGLLARDFDPVGLARVYAHHGAAAISVLTDQAYFGGSLKDLREIAKIGTGLPLLRKDFVFERYQLLEARLAGASAVLLIVAMLSRNQLCRLIENAVELDLVALVEVHNLDELQQAADCGAHLIGINNRDLHTFEVSLGTTFELMKHKPEQSTLVAESGIRTLEDVEKLDRAGVDAMLVGEALVSAKDIAVKTAELARLKKAVM